ncbi:A/G-specific adenine glycosylase [Chromatium okenii]|nr:A/G-specific adenine glycosylase [Chromatium okenii]
MSEFTPAAIASALLSWFDQHGRHTLPWQHDPTPYRVWVSEIMLQQTQVAVVIPYFERFMARFPTVATLAAAPLDAVLAQWTGLGYYARARHLHRTAQLLCAQYQGEFPREIAQVQALPGIGRSTAGAILTFAAGQSHPILDGNVKRVLSRCFALEGWSGRPEVTAQLWALATNLTPLTRTAAYNQALMDLGATLCTRRHPACDRCPLLTLCRAHAQQRQHEFPTSRPRPPLTERTALLLLIRSRCGKIVLHQRPPTGIWGGLWSLPEVALDADPTAWCRTHLDLSPQHVERPPARRHSFTHFKLKIELARLVVATAGIITADRCCWFDVAQLSSIGLPAPVKKIIMADNDALRAAECDSVLFHNQ